MKNVNFTLCVLLVMGLLITGGAQAQPPCGDIDGSGGLPTISDVAKLIDGVYLSENLDATQAASAAGLDGYEGVTSNDIMSLLGWMFIDPFVEPPCNTGFGSAYPASDDTLKFSDLLVPAGAETCTVDILLHALTEFHTLSLAFEYDLGGDDIEYVDAEWLVPADLSQFELHDAATNRLSLAMLNIFTYPSGEGCPDPMFSYTPIVRLTFSVTSSTEDRYISVTPIDWERSYCRHTTVLSRWNIAESKFNGMVPVILTYADNPDEDAHGNFCFGGVRGNVDGSWDEVVDITDLQVLIDYQFISMTEPLALGEADVAPLEGADGIVDVSDVSALVDHLFLTLTDLPTCDECVTAKRAPQVAGSISTIHQDGRTYVNLTTDQELRGLQLVLKGDNSSPVATSPLSGSLDLMVGQNDGDVLVGLIDLDGPGTLPIGDRQVLELNGTYDVTSARAASMDHVTVALSLGAEGNLPRGFSLDQNYPNPFNPDTEIGFSVPVRSRVQLVVYNALGQRVKTLANDVMDAGPARVSWDATDQAGNSVASGVYFYRLTIGENTDAKKMLLLK